MKMNEAQPITLVEFFATWCPHCMRMMPVVEDIKSLFAGQIKVTQLDIDKYTQAAEEAGVDATPTFILYVGDQEVWRQAGEMEASQLANAIRSVL